MKQEILTTEEFARRLKIGRSSLFEWLRKGVLVQGRDYFKVGRVLRFVWSDDLIESLLANSVSVSVEGGKLPSSVPPTRHTKQGNKSTPSINWDY